jgi:hypothetical protein
MYINNVVRFIRDGKIQEYNGRHLKPLFNVSCPCPNGGMAYHHYIDYDRKCINCGMLERDIKGAKDD